MLILPWWCVCVHRSFDFAFEIARTALKSKLPEIHLKYALYLEDEVSLEMCAQPYVLCGPYPYVLYRTYGLHTTYDTFTSFVCTMSYSL